MNFEKITALLKALYGEATAASLREELAALMTATRPTAGAAPAIELSERATLMITYADQLREPGVAPAATLAEFAKARLADVISGVHLLPFFPWSSDDGFSVKDFFGVDPIFGAWSDIEQFRPEFDLMFDAVFNHMSAEGEWFQKFCADEPAFRDFFVTVSGNPDLSLVVRPRALPLLTEFQTTRGPEKVWTTFSADQVDLNFKNPQVLLASLRALLFYVARGARFIRLDAIAYLWKEIGTTCIHLEQTHQIIQLMRAVLDEVAPGVRLITETNVPHRDNISYFGDGTNEAQLVYNFALPPLVLHSIATGNAEKLTRWAATLETPSPQTTFFNFLASHDGIGLNPARGILSQAEIDALVARALAHGGYISYKHNSDGSKSPYEMNVTYFDALSSPERNEPVELQVKRFLVAHAIMFSLAGVPGIYFHSLFGSRNDRAGAESSGIPRRINRQKLARKSLEAELADPGSLRARVFSGMRHWLEKRRASRAFAPGAAQQILTLDPRVFALVREPRGGHERQLCLHNVSGDAVALPAGGELSGAITLRPYEICWKTLSPREVALDESKISGD
jgi:glycosidase